MYAVVGPGVKGVYREIRDVNNILLIYPYAKFRKFQTERECWDYIHSHTPRRMLESITSFGRAFPVCRVIMTYYIHGERTYYNFNTKFFGTLRLTKPVDEIDIRADRISACVNTPGLDNMSISSHLLAIQYGLILLGRLTDVEVIVPDHSIFYAIRSYTGTHGAPKRLREFIEGREGQVSVTLK